MLGQYLIPAGTRIWINVRSLHLDDKYFHNAKVHVHKIALLSAFCSLLHSNEHEHNEPRQTWYSCLFFSQHKSLTNLQQVIDSLLTTEFDSLSVLDAGLCS